MAADATALPIIAILTLLVIFHMYSPRAENNTVLCPQTVPTAAPTIAPATPPPAAPAKASPKTIRAAKANTDS